MPLKGGGNSPSKVFLIFFFFFLMRMKTIMLFFTYNHSMTGSHLIPNVWGSLKSTVGKTQSVAASPTLRICLSSPVVLPSTRRLRAPSAGVMGLHRGMEGTRWFGGLLLVPESLEVQELFLTLPWALGLFFSIKVGQVLWISLRFPFPPPECQIKSGFNSSN